MSKKLLFLVLCLITSMGMAFSQNQTITGKVIYADDEQPVIGASVQVVGTRLGTQTDLDGNFRLTNVPADATIRVSYIGMKTVELPAAPGMVVRLEGDAEQLETLVFTGYRVQSSRSFTGAVAKVSSDVIEKKSDANFVKSLEGAVTGVQMNNSTSMPGTWGAIFVRGRGSLSSGTQPLYVIDGVPVNSDADGISSSSNNFSDPMAAINPNDIDNVTVLKDAAATAIYGARAANGVIVITTKRGSQGKFNINAEIKQGFTKMAPNNMKFANASQTMELFAQGRYNSGEAASIDEAKEYLTQYYKWDGKSSYDWMDAITRTGYYQDYNVGITGSAGNTNYFVSMGYLNTEGIVINSDFERYSGRANLYSKFKVFTFGLNTSYSKSYKNGFSQSTAGANSSPVVGAISSMLPFYPFRNEDGTYFGAGRLWNPLAVQDKKLGDLNKSDAETITISPNLQVDFGKGIYAKTTLGVNVYNLRDYQYWSGVYSPQGVDYPGAGYQYISQTKTITLTNLIGWNYTFLNRHDISVMLGQEMQRKNFVYDYYQGTNFPFASIGMRDLSTAGSWGDSEYYRNAATFASYFADAQYSLDYKYYLSASFRRDGFSGFGKDNLWGDFWSVGAKWRFSGEKFLENKVITNGMLRASYGTVGNSDIGWYASRGFYIAGANYHGSAGMVPGGLANDKLTWEVSKKLDIGLELQFINRINLDIDFYNEVTSDALYASALSRTTGMSSATRNIGKIRNRGFEGSINATIINNSKLNWTAYLNATFNRNKILKLATGPEEGDFTILKEGRPYYQFYMKEYAGVDKETGNPLFYLNATGNETTTEINDAAKRYVGSALPKVYGGFGTQLSFMGVDASIAFNYRLGAKVFDTGARFFGWGMSFRTPLKEWAKNAWNENNKNAKYPKYVGGDPMSATSSIHSRFLYNGNYLRISNITLGYTLPKNITQKAYIEKLRVYVSADNIYTFTHKDFYGYTPETYSDGRIAWQYPAASTFVFGIQITL